MALKHMDTIITNFLPLISLHINRANILFFLSKRKGRAVVSNSREGRSKGRAFMTTHWRTPDRGARKPAFGTTTPKCYELPATPRNYAHTLDRRKTHIAVLLSHDPPSTVWLK